MRGQRQPPGPGPTGLRKAPMDSPPSLPTVRGGGCSGGGKRPPQNPEKQGWQPPKTFELRSWGKVIPNGGQSLTATRGALGQRQGCGYSLPRPKHPPWKQLCPGHRGRQRGPQREALEGEGRRRPGKLAEAQAWGRGSSLSQHCARNASASARVTGAPPLLLTASP